MPEGTDVVVGLSFYALQRHRDKVDRLALAGGFVDMHGKPNLSAWFRDLVDGLTEPGPAQHTPGPSRP